MTQLFFSEINVINGRFRELGKLINTSTRRGEGRGCNRMVYVGATISPLSRVCIYRGFISFNKGNTSLSSLYSLELQRKCEWNIWCLNVSVFKLYFSLFFLISGR